MAARYDLPVCPHVGLVGLCKYVRRLSRIAHLVISGSQKDRMAEYVDHLQEHFVEPCNVIGSAYLAPKQPGFSITMPPESLAQYEYRA
jgi:L-fuconate dehydratase